jgi:hypothetical protein
METRMDRPSRETGTAAGGVGSRLLVALAALACPLLCLGPLAGLASAGLTCVLPGAPRRPISGAALIIIALGTAIGRARGARPAQDWCAPVPDRLPRDGTTR